MKLHFRELGTGAPLIIMHGLFGLSDNWQTLAKYFAQKYKVYLVDLRNHGRSPHSPDFNYSLMVQDMVELIRDQHIHNPAVLGHSMGGKVAMQLALHHSELVSKLMVVDIAPRSYPPHHQDILTALHNLDLSIVKTRSEVDEALAKHIPEQDVRLFLSKNLYRQEDNSFAWRMNFPAIETNIAEVGKETTGTVPFLKPTLFIRGGNSRYIKPEKDTEPILKLFPEAKIETIPNAGHWVHAEAPEPFYKLVVDFLDAI